jgi:hypothetical protein
MDQTGRVNGRRRADRDSGTYGEDKAPGEGEETGRRRLRTELRDHDVRIHPPGAENDLSEPVVEMLQRRR